METFIVIAWYHLNNGNKLSKAQRKKRVIKEINHWLP